MRLQLFKECKIKKNDVIEKTAEYDIFTYLNTLNSDTIDNLNLNKSIFDDLVCEIKLNRQLKNIDVYSYNYAMLEYNGYKYFYFIANKEWVADSTTKLVMYLDSCNTYEYRNNIITDTSKWRRANVIREHRDRYTSDRVPIIDKIDEGFGTLPMIISATKLLKNSDDKYYLGYYKTNDENQRYYTQVMSDNGSNLNKDVSYLNGAYNTYITSNYGAMLVFVDANNQMYDKLRNKNINVLYVRLLNNFVTISNGYFVTNGAIVFPKEDTDQSGATSLELIAETNLNIKYLVGTTTSTFNIEYGKPYSFSDLLNTYTEAESILTTSIDITIRKLSNTLLSDTNLLKLIEIPYISTDNLIGYYDTTLKSFVGALGSNLLKSSFTFDISDMYSITLPKNLYGIKTKSKYETKIFGSQFTLNQFKYDSFNYNINLEDLDLTKTSFNIETYIPNDMSTSVAFKFNYEGVTRNEFDRWLLTSRNNQVPTMTNEYLDYMQNGYNYDVKNRAIQSAMSWGQLIGNFASGGLMLGSSINANRELSNQLIDLADINKNSLISNINYLDRHKGLGSVKRASLQDSINRGITTSANALRMNSGVAGAISIGNISNAIVSTIGTLANNIVRDVQSRNAIEQRKKDYLNSSINISNTDDLSLFHLYNEGNKLRFSQYKLEDSMLNNVYQLLRFTGYSTNEYKIPDLTSRIDYNFIQANVEFKGDYFIPERFFDDIVESLSIGVTIFHRLYTGSTYIYDLDREYENWEVAIIGSTPTPTIKLTAPVLEASHYDDQKISCEITVINPNDTKVTYYDRDVNDAGYIDIEATKSIEYTYKWLYDEDVAESHTFTGYFTATGYDDSDKTSITVIKGGLLDIQVTAEMTLNDDGTFSNVSYTLTNPNKVKIKAKGTFKVDDTILLQDFIMTAGEVITGVTIVDGSTLTLDATIEEVKE